MIAIVLVAFVSLIVSGRHRKYSLDLDAGYKIGLILKDNSRKI